MSQPYRSPSDIYPGLTYDDAAGAIEWLCRAFGFTKRFVVQGSGNRVEHSELSLGTGVVMVGSPQAADRRVSPKGLAGVAQGLSVFVADPDAHYKTAVAAGARVVRELRTEEYGGQGLHGPRPGGSPLVLWQLSARRVLGRLMHALSCAGFGKVHRLAGDIFARVRLLAPHGVQDRARSAIV